uniref:Neopullulanase 2 n=1 Tax=uncultured bacterium Contigcl_1794 TaxID=1393664 RepID=W0FMQ8_9BACT|nr:neopullulanase 2 [uncultured bacterium Contigcl_1794]
MAVSQTVLSAVFSDETPIYRFPSEPDPGDSVRIRMRVAKDSAKRVIILFDSLIVGALMTKERSDDYFDYYVAKLVCNDHEVMYRFLIECEDGTRIEFDKCGARVEEGSSPDFNPAYAFRFIPGFHVPGWAKGAVQYQIFTDRFCNGDPSNDVTDNEYYYTVGHAKHIADWNALPTDTDIRAFYGGDLQGIIDKLDYLQDLGIEVLYLNPIFVSPSSHKYDCQDYEHIDPHFGVITDDVDHTMQMWEKHNGYAPRYIRRVTSMENLEKSDALFAKLCAELHSRGMKIILDGVFNHCGSFNKWMDHEGIYLGKAGFQPGAFQSVHSPYRSFFHFNDSSNGRSPVYEGWWGYSTLPKLNYEGSPELQEEIMKIVEKWLSPPYSIDGWRLDVAADLGHSAAFNHKFWREFRSRVKAVNPDALIIAEHYGDPSAWLNGKEWDSIMNYDAFMEPVTWFLTGMEKHSDSYRDDLYQNGSAFFGIMRDKMARFKYPSLMCAMNELSNHDHSRFLTRTNRMVGRMTTMGSAAAGAGINKGVFREAVTIQMTWPGAPTVYYADEAGQVGWTDPDDRRTYPWGHEDQSLIDLHRDLIHLRKELPVLAGGCLKQLLADYGRIAYARFDEENRCIVAVNNTGGWTDFRLYVRDAGAKEGEVFYRRAQTTQETHSVESERWGVVTDGYLVFDLPPYSSAIVSNAE